MGSGISSVARVIRSASVKSKCLEAVARAAAYICGRQSPRGGFCFYRHGNVDEPNLADTYYAVAALRLFGAHVPHARSIASFVGRARIFGVTHLYFCAFALERLALSARVGEPALQLIRDLRVVLPVMPRSPATSGWLESTRMTVRLQKHFLAAQAATAYSPLVAFLQDDMTRSGFEIHGTLWDTYLALSIGSLLGLRGTAESAAFVDSLQRPPFGFQMTSSSTMSGIDAAYAGLRCCDLLSLPVKHEHEVIEFCLACQAANGGFAHVPGALPNLEFTYRGLQCLALLLPAIHAPGP